MNRHNRRRCRNSSGKPSFPPHACPSLQVVLRSINSSLSAYLSVTYNANFFDSYDVLDCTVVQAGLLMKVGRGGGPEGPRQSVCGWQSHAINLQDVDSLLVTE